MKRFITILLLAFSISSIHAATINVPLDQPSIQSGINAAINGDTVLVAPGLYNQTIYFMGKNIVVTSSGGPAVTTIQAQGLDSAVVYFVMGEPKGAEISGFTLTGGFYSGVCIDTASATVRDNIITGNTTPTYGNGGGIRIANSTGSVIQGNIIYGNTADRYGAAIAVRSSGYDTIAYNVIYDNTGTGDIFTSTSTIIDLQVYNNTISSVTYAGIYHLGWGTLYARNNIVVNAPNYGMRMVYDELAAEYNCMYNNAQDFSFMPTGVNLSADPSFSDEGNYDYSLKDVSLCIDAGHPDAVYNDLDGTRNDIGALPHLVAAFPIAIDIEYGLGNDDHAVFVAQPDILWTYFDSSMSSQSQYQVQVGTDMDWSVAEMWDSGPVASWEAAAVYLGSPLADHQTYYVRVRVNDGAQWGDWRYDYFVTRFVTIINVPGDYATIQEAVDASLSGDTVYVASGTYTGPGNRDIDFGGKNILLQTTTTTALTIIDCTDGLLEHHAFHFHSGEDSTAVIDGFTITGANTDLGAVTILNSGPTIRNCAVIENDATGIYAGQSAPNYLRHKPIVANCTIRNNTGDGVWWISNGRMTGCTIAYNGGDGIFLADPDTVVISNCLVRGNTENGINIWAMSGGYYSVSNNTFYDNNVGLYYYYEPPKAIDGTSAMLEGAPISYNIMAFNRTYGVVGEGLGLSAAITECNDSYGNPDGNWADTVWGPHDGDAYGNISSNPLFCGAAYDDFTISSASACAPDNNSCGVLIGAFDIGCTTCCVLIRGNIDGDLSDTIDIGDLVYLVQYMFQGGPEPPCREEANVDGLGVPPMDIDVADLVYLVNYMFISGPAPVNCP